ncbi:30S ribosomal protein S16 [Candidatus Dojkabacteria bacterium HGW-Dojkabacteria-1]|uniref:Small ribosomal subunit protein bS16 n=1 Tax=Candidatus Dojkabacteria bacterium HGW-Dojkabacteria-1 TaxID=2013761 RepID=A0A2N2F422_9BACT|nr:MAG: 30S ribosomal protein S16 [Candidatus Dojkabacteria bacterium HGW-Dojkabacteria-1]
MLKIRLKRIGKRGQPHYRIVVMESASPRSGKTVEEIGIYNPRTKPSTFEVDKEAAKKWLENGAKPTDTIAQYFVKIGLLKSLKRGSKKPSTEKKTEENK